MIEYIKIFSLVYIAAMFLMYRLRKISGVLYIYFANNTLDSPFELSFISYGTDL